MERFPGRTHSGKTDLASIGDLLITGDAALVRAARLRRGRGPSVSATMAKRISDMSARYDLWVLSNMGFSSFAGSANQAKTPATPMNDALKSIEQFSAGLGLSGDFLLNVEVVTRDVTAAQSLGSTAQMALAMATQNVAKDTSTQAALQRMKFGVEGRTLRLSITVPAEEMQKQMEMMKAQAQSGAFGNGLGLGPGVAAFGRASGDKSSNPAECGSGDHLFTEGYGDGSYFGIQEVSLPAPFRSSKYALDVFDGLICVVLAGGSPSG